MKNLFILLVVLSSFAMAFLDPENGNNFIEFVDIEPSGQDEKALHLTAKNKKYLKS